MRENMVEEGFSYYQGYVNKGFRTKGNKKHLLPNELHVETWEAYLKEAKDKGVYATLKSKLVQLQFPIQASLSKTDGYKRVTLRGKIAKENDEASGLKLKQPDIIELSILTGPIGAIPVVQIPNAKDFSDIVCALAYKNEPVQLPSAMGASLIRGLNNWDRIYTLKREWLKSNTSFSWPSEFKNNIIPNTPLYQDTLMLLSKKPYSGIDHFELGLSKDDWLEKSFAIRMYHEYAHYFTVRVYNQMSKNMYDEILADYLGISMAYGIYDSSLFLMCIGLENYPKYRQGGRLENYIDRDKLNETEFDELKNMCSRASENIERFDHQLGMSTQLVERIKRLNVLCQFKLRQLAQRRFHTTLIQSYYSNHLKISLG